jgi:hypothetical protein
VAKFFQSKLFWVLFFIALGFCLVRSAQNQSAVQLYSTIAVFALSGLGFVTISLTLSLCAFFQKELKANTPVGRRVTQEVEEMRKRRSPAWAVICFAAACDRALEKKNQS